METYNSETVKSITFTGSIAIVHYFGSLTDCANVYGLKNYKQLQKLIKEGGLAPDGKTFFDYPTQWEMDLLDQGELKYS